jgi:hypothetical protein
MEAPMKKSANAKTIASIAVCVLAGALLPHCGPTQPVNVVPPGNGGNSGTSTLPATGGNSTGGHAGGASSAIIGTLPTGGSGGASSSSSSEVVPPTGDVNCGTQTQNPTPQPVDLLLLLDRSGSMSNDIATDTACSTGRGAAACTTKWSTMTASLTQVFATSPAGVQWGLKFFSSPGGKTACTVNPGVEVAVGPNTATQIQAAITGATPANQTPTTAAMTASVAYYGTVNDGLAHYILLATDGQPNCDPGTSSNVTDASVQDTANEIATALSSSNIKTYVIGIGPSAGNLDSFAAAGGTGTYFPASSPDALTAALTSIVGAVASCTFTMAAVPPDPTNLGVYLDKNTKVPLDASDGYSLASDNVTVTFNGSYCDGLKNGTYQVVQVYFGCPGSPPPINIP